MPRRIHDPGTDGPSLVGKARAGDLAATSRLVTYAEAGWRLPVPLRRPDTGGRSTHVVGVTGPPGVGKSTLVAALASASARGGQRVAVLAIDPSSPRSGGSVLGDRVRMRGVVSTDVYIRSMSSRGRLGGLSRCAPLVIDLLEQIGFEVVMVETVGVGQSEVDVASVVDSVLVVAAAGAGDEMQAQKAGILEIADIYVVNKADAPGSAQVARQLATTAAMVDLGMETLKWSWSRPVVTTIAATGDVADLIEAIGRHAKFLDQSGVGGRRRTRRHVESLQAECVIRLSDWLRGPGGSLATDLAAAVEQGSTASADAVTAVYVAFVSSIAIASTGPPACEPGMPAAPDCA